MERDWRALFDAIPTPVYLWRAQPHDFVLEGFNAAAAAYTPVPMEHFVGIKASNLFGGEPEIPQALRRCATEQRSFEADALHTLLDGRQRAYRAKYVYVASDLVMVQTEDVTEQRGLQRALKRSEQRLRHAEQVARLGHFTVDAATMSVELSAELYRLFDLDPSDASVDDVRERLAPADLESLRQAVKQSLASGEGLQAEVRLGRERDARVLHVLAEVREDDAAPSSLFGVVQDITESKRMLAQLAQADRMANVGLLAGGVAHEINNPMTYVRHHLESLVEDLGGGVDELRLEELSHRAAAALEGAERVSDLCAHLRMFSNVGDNKPALLDVHEVLDSAIALSANELRYRARLHKRYTDCPPLYVNADRLGQVFLNLLVNAAHAIDEGRVESNSVTVRTSHADGQVRVEIEDTGAGIPSEHLETIFEPFFTMQDDGQATGLGLSICRRIVRSYDGDLTASSRRGEGTCMTVRLPAAPATARAEQASSSRPAAAAAATAAPEADSGRARVLVVDDEPEVATIIGRVLGTHDVTVAVGGEAAQRLIGAGESYHVILCDLMMPKVSGMDLWAWLGEEHAHLQPRVVFMTGGAFTPRARALLDSTDNVCLDKPFALRELKHVVQATAERAQASIGDA